MDIIITDQFNNKCNNVIFIYLFKNGRTPDVNNVFIYL